MPSRIAPSEMGASGNIATELAFRPELATPPLAIEAALPALRAASVTIRVGKVTPVPRGVQVELDVR